MSAVLSGRPVAEAGWLAWLRRPEVERRLALLLTILAVVCGLAAYVVISQKPPYGARVRTVLLLLSLDLVLLLGLALIIARRLVKVVVEWRQGHAGSRLHTRLVVLFSLVAGVVA